MTALNGEQGALRCLSMDERCHCHSTVQAHLLAQLWRHYIQLVGSHHQHTSFLQGVVRQRNLPAGKG